MYLSRCFDFVELNNGRQTHAQMFPVFSAKFAVICNMFFQYTSTYTYILFFLVPVSWSWMDR